VAGRAPDGANEFLDEQRYTEGHEQAEQGLLAIEGAHKRHLDDHADNTDT
jgi:hypothetical protein